MSTALPSTPAARSGRWSAWLGPAAGAIFFVLVLGVLHHDGVSFGALARYVAYVAWGLLLPGFVVRRSLWAPATTWFAEFVWATCTGLAVELVAWAVCVGLGFGGALRFWPVVTLLTLVRPAWRARLTARPASKTAPIEVAAVFLSGLSLLWMLHRLSTQQLLPGSGQRTYPDLLWHMGLVHEAKRSFPLGTPQAVGAGNLHYHWYSDAHMAAASLISGVPVPVEVLRLFPALFFLLVFGSSIAAARELSSARWAGCLAAVLAAATTTFAPFPWLYSSFTTYAPLSPSQLYAGPLTVLAVLSVVQLLAVTRDGGSSRSDVVRAWLGVALAALALSGAKASAPVSLLGGIGLLWLWSLRARQSRRTTTALLAGCVVLVGVALTLVAGGDSGTQKQLFAALGAAPVYRRLVTPHPGTGLVLPHLLDHPWLFAGLLAGLLLTLCLLVATLLLTASGSGRRRPEFWLLSGTIIAATAVFLVMRHLGLSEFYFVMGVLQLGVIGASVGLAERGESLSGRRRTTVAALGWGCFVVALLGLFVGHVTKPGRADLPGLLRASVIVFVLMLVLAGLVAKVARLSFVTVVVAGAVGVSAAATVYSPLVTKSRPVARSATVRHEQAAGAWIEAHVPDGALLATNQHCSGREREVCRSNQWWVSGLGGRRVLVDGWSYVPASANDEPFYDTRLLTENQRAFTVGDDDAVQALERRGVTYLVAVKGATPIAPRLSQTAEKVYGNADVNVYRVR